MRVLRKFAAASAAAVVMLAGGAVTAHADGTPTVYNTPGGQVIDGRLWNTTCETYSSTVVRCRAEIWATTVVYENGRFVKRTGWSFNNLSYLPSSRASWANNNLGRSNDNWTSEGRKWRTECDTAATGNGGCRSYLLTDVVKPVTGSGYVTAKEWVFNSLVLFSSPTIPAVRTVPSWIIDQSRLTPTGLGPLQVGTSMKDLTTLGYLVTPDPQCNAGYGENQYLKNRGIDVRGGDRDGVLDIGIYTKGVRTEDGAQVGMTLGQLKGIYGSRLGMEEKFSESSGTYLQAAVVADGGNELVFLFDSDEGATPVNSDVINLMVAREKSSGLNYDGC